MATLINGNGNESVFAQQDADWFAGVAGNVTRILNVGSKMAATIEDANTIALADGVIITKEGRRVQIDVGNIDEFTIPTGAAGVTRYYIIGFHLYTDGSANQKCETFVQLMSDGSETITENTFRNGATEVYISVYRVQQDGLTLNDPVALLTVGETMEELKAAIVELNSDLTEQFIFDTVTGTEKLIYKLDAVGTYSNYTALNNLSIPAISGYSIKSIAVRPSNLYVFITYAIAYNADGSATVNGNGFSCANSHQNCAFVADVIYKKDSV